jgi:exodeoxyribonuclease V beta subunit
MTKKPPSDNPDILAYQIKGMSLIEASAGTGKTWSICGLYLRLLLEKKLAVPKILVVTFTNAATAELKERIRARIMEMLLFLEGNGPQNSFLSDLKSHLDKQRVDQGEMQRLLKEALASFDEAAISTIHGFCGKVAGTLAFGAGQPFSFTIEHEERKTLIHVVHDFWRRHVAADTLGRTMAMYLNAIRITPEGLAAFLQREMEKPLAEKHWPEHRAPLDETKMEPLIAAYGRLEKGWRECRETLPDVIAEAVAAKELSGAKYGRPMANIMATYDMLFQRKDPLALSILSDDTARTRLWRLSTSGMDDGKNSGKIPPSHPFFALAENWLALRDEALKRLELAYLHLLELLSKETDEVRRRRQENRVLSSNDMLYRLHAALSDPGMPAAIRRLYPAALIDEFQDTDLIQFSIFNKIYAESDAPVFFVGDPKQAIYRFRNADLHTYFAAKRKVHTLYSLTQNHRSTRKVINACNAFFKRNPKAFMLEELDYKEVSPFSREQKEKDLTDESDPASKSDYGMMIWRLPKTGDSGYLSRHNALARSAEAVAGEIARLLLAGQQNQIRIGDAPLKAENMAILVRTHNEARRMQQALAARGLASVSLSPGSVWESREATELVTILSAVATPRNQSRLRAALATEMLGLDAPAIEKLTTHDEEQLFWVERFMTYKANWLERGVSFVLRQIMGEQIMGRDAYARILSLPDGERRLTNILHLAELLNDASQTHPMPESLLNWMVVQQESGLSDEQTQIRLESDEGLVRIMTIYAAKGLEFPFVFCPFLWDAWRDNRGDSLDGMEYHDEEQLVIDFRRHDPASEAAIKNRMAIEVAADRIRLVYVALTRAIYRCYVVAGCYAQPAGRTANMNHSTSGTLNWLVAGTDITPEEWISDGNDERVALIEEGWKELAKGCITLKDLPMDRKETGAAPLIADKKTQSPTMPKKIPAGWRIGSYSALIYGASHEALAGDHDERVQDMPPPDAPEMALDASDILFFPASRYAGNCLHAVFEQVDFTDERTWDAAIADALLRHPPYGRIHTEAGKTQKELKDMIRQMLENVLATPLHDGMKLSGIGQAKRLTELEFFLPAKNVSANELNEHIGSHYPVSKLEFPTLEGYIKGLIDLVIEHDGRFYILDWKSNFLGNRQTDYGDEALDAAMAEHNYHLQHLLYTVALDRYLARRMPNYAYDTHFGGVLYLFVRGVRPTWLRKNGMPSGVFFCRTDKSLVRKLNALLGQKEGV